MRNARSILAAGCWLAVVAGTPGCLVRTRVISRPGSRTGAPRSLITSSREDLVGRLVTQYKIVRSFTATVDMTPETGSVYKGEITDYKDISAYVLYRKPSDIRIIGLAPVVRSKVFDMVSSGPDFRIFIPIKNRFVEGRNDAMPESKNTLENLRPEAFLRAMIVPPPQADVETPLLVDATDEQSSFYQLFIIGKTPKGELMMKRTIFFDRTSLLVVRQIEYDPGGTILSDSQYKNWRTTDGIPFPRTIDVSRPKDGYGVLMTVVKLAMNSPIGDDKFVLDRPEGTTLQVIGPKPAATAGSEGPAR